MPATTQQHPGGDYYVFLPTHSIQRQANPLLAAGLKAADWMGPYSYTQAKAIIAQATKSAPGTGTNWNPLAGSPVANLGGISAIGDFFNRLTEANTWLRVGEFAAGALLIYLGLSAAMRGTEAQQATQTITKPVKKAVDLAPPVRSAKIARSAKKRVARERSVNKKAQAIRAKEKAKAKP